MSLVVIQNGSKQYLVEKGSKIKLEKLPAEPGKVFVFNEVLLKENAGKVELGKPLIEGAIVEGKVLEQDRADKVIIFKYKAKKRYKVKKGHKQPYTLVEITKV
ncbi:50S ribosomal protein L21 [Candidatus Parcubacteria bacterium]|nr:50S ribosomal protein L21 [Candidatus Parcubacteria bacterium]